MLGVCYYPEHWPEDLWQADAADMKALGLDYVRIGEFAWSRVEPLRGQFDFAWLDRGIEVLADAGLAIVFGIPTATPPKWLIDEFPEILPVDPETGRVRGFGSRRHYDFSSETYRTEALRITGVLAKRYGGHDAIVGWQTDNELCCHDTALSASQSARAGFRLWCEKRYGSAKELNEAWGNVFWSMEYGSFDEIELPVGAVTETNPAHRLAYRRYASDTVVAFHDAMVATIRAHAPGRWITHNFIPKEDLAVDTFALGEPLDFASYDNYPLGRADIVFADAPAEVMRRYMRTGHPDFGPYYLDATRSFSKGDFWVMEQQPGPVNWAPHNPRPLPGMVRFWSLEAFAHGAACVSYFRWRQAPFAQEQMHGALRRPDNSKATAWDEVAQVRGEIDALHVISHKKQISPVALVTDVQALWVTEIQRQGRGYDFARLEFAYYSALRRLGIDVDFISAKASLDGYKLIVVPCLPIVDDEFVARCEAEGGHIIFGPRSGSKTGEFSIPQTLPPGALQRLIPIRILSVETLRPDCAEDLHWNGRAYDATIWCEEIDAGDADVVATFATGAPAVVRSGTVTYIGTVTDDGFLQDFLRAACAEAGIPTLELPQDLRICRRGGLEFAFNYAAEPQTVPAPEDAIFELGGRELGPHDVAVWRRPQNR